mgnify:CR=1 FL=1
MKICDFEVGLDKPLFLIAGTCVIEEEGLILDVAGQIREITRGLGVRVVFMASFD